MSKRGHESDQDILERLVAMIVYQRSHENTELEIRMIECKVDGSVQAGVKAMLMRKDDGTLDLETKSPTVLAVSRFLETLRARAAEPSTPFEQWEVGPCVVMPTYYYPDNIRVRILTSELQHPDRKVAPVRKTKVPTHPPLDLDANRSHGLRVDLSQEEPVELDVRNTPYLSVTQIERQTIRQTLCLNGFTFTLQYDVSKRASGATLEDACERTVNGTGCVEYHLELELDAPPYSAEETPQQRYMHDRLIAENMLKYASCFLGAYALDEHGVRQALPPLELTIFHKDR